MGANGSLPSYERLFGDLDFRPGDDSRSVYSPAAYLADLLQLVEDNFTGGTLLERRPGLREITLDAENTFTETPYLDIVNEILEGLLADPYTMLRELRFPFDMPFSLQHVTLRKYFEHLGVTGEEFYRLFASPERPDVVAREFLGLSPEDVAMVTTVRTGEADVLACYGTTATLAGLHDVEGFRRATMLTGAQVRELLFQHLPVTPREEAGQPGRAEASAFFVHQGGVCVTVDDEETALVWGDGSAPVPAEWFERVNRFVRLARLTGLALTELDLVLRTCCGNRIDHAALRTVAVVVYLRDVYDLPIDVVCALAAPMDTVGIRSETPQDLFSRTFNAPAVTGAAPSVIISPSPGAGPAVLACSGDILAARNAEYRARVARSLAMPESDITETVTRFRLRYSATPLENSPFDRGGMGLAALSLLHRVARLCAALGVSAAELFDVLEAVESDASIRGHTTFRILIDTDGPAEDCYRMLEGSDAASALWLAQTLYAVVRWTQAAGFTGRELVRILGGPSTRAAEEPGGEEERLHLDVLGALCREFEQAALHPGLFVSSRFGERASQVVHDVLTAYEDGVVSPVDGRLLRFDPAKADAPAHDALTDLGVLAREDFTAQGLGDRLTEKIFTALVMAGYLRADGTLAEDRLPASTGELSLSTGFEEHREALFASIRGLAGAGERGADAEPAEPASFYPSDLAGLAGLGGLSAAERAELYDNLVFHRYIDEAGEVLRPEFFADPANAGRFEVGADLADVAPAVLALLRERVERFAAERLALDPEIFAGLRLGEAETAVLLDSLRFNGHLDQDSCYLDKGALLGLGPDDLGIAARFHPHRRAVLDAMRTQIEEFRAGLTTFVAEDFTWIADDAAAQRVVDALEGDYTDAGRVREDVRAVFEDPEGHLGLGEAFTAAEEATIRSRVAAILTEERPYRLDPAALTELGFDDEERPRLLARLAAAGHLGGGLSVPPDRLGYFANPGNALDFTLSGLEDYARDVFFLLHDVAGELSAGIAEITGTLEAQAERQRTALFTVLQDAFGVPAATLEAVCVAVTGGAADAVEVLVAPALAAWDDTPADQMEIAAVPADPRHRLAYRRIRRFALLAGKLGLSAVEAGVAFHDQDLVGKFPEPLVLPPGLDRFDALLESFDGRVYLFEGDRYWTYTAGSYTLVDDRPAPLTDLPPAPPGSPRSPGSPALAGLTGIDAAFTDPSGEEWIVGHGADGVSRAFARRPGGRRWAPRERVWGKVRNNFAAPARIDSAFVDEDGRTYLFCGDQYVRYSGDGYATVDEGYPRGIGEWWEAEGHTAPLPEAFRESIDACFQDSRDRWGGGGRIHLFAGDRWLAAGEDATDLPIAGTWGRVRNTLAETGRLDAAYTDGAALYLLSGDQVLRYTDSVENDGVCVGDGYPRRVGTHLRGLPAEFEGALEAAFTDRAGRLHLFRNGRTMALTPDGEPVPLTPGEPVVAPTAQRWGLLGDVLAGGAVDSAFVGLDGRTYLFSGTRYLRYSGPDYSAADSGYPRAVAGDWGGLRRVTASFVLDRATYLFGAAGLLFAVAAEHEAELDTGRLSPALRRRFQEHGITFAEDASAEGRAPEWRLTADGGIGLVIRRAADRLDVHAAETGQAAFYVKYSTRDYTTPDAGYPRPLADNWWNLPASLVRDPAFTTVDAVFTGRDDRTYLFSGDRFVVFDARRRWWSEPRALREHWDGIPFERVDAAFVGRDGRTYVFSGDRYARYSTGDYTRVDDRYPAPVAPFWGNVVNNLARTGRVDAALVMDVKETVEKVETVRHYTYLFSGDQYVRYEGDDYSRVQDGYPRAVAALSAEPGLGALPVTLDGVDAAFADRGTAYLVRGSKVYAVSASAHRVYDGPEAAGVGCAFLEDGALMVEGSQGWRRRSGVEGVASAETEVRPRTLRAVPEEFRTGLSAVLHGADGNTYLFKGSSCFNVRLNREYPLAEEWGRPRDNVYHRNAVDAAFVGEDGRTYLFSGDQFIVDGGARHAADPAEGEPRPVAAHWGGLTGVTLAYVREGRTHLFEPAGPDGTMRYVVYSGEDYLTPDPGYPRTTDSTFWDIPDGYRAEGFTAPDAVLFEGDTMLLLRGEEVLQRDERTGAWSYPRPIERVWRGFGAGLEPGDRLRTAFTGSDGTTYFFFRDSFAAYSGRTFSPLTPIRDRWGGSSGSFAAGTGTVDAAFVHRGHTTYLFSGDRYVRYTGPEYRYADPGYPRPILGNLRAEEPFAHLPESFEDVVLAAGPGPVVRAVVAGRRNVHLFTGDTCHVVSQDLAATYDLDLLGRVRNVIAERGKVDAALVTDSGTLLFSGDQYVRYSGTDREFADEGYPLTIEGSLAAELGLAALPPQFHDGIDAAFRGTDGRTYLFRDGHCLGADATTSTVSPVTELWGRVRNTFTEGTPGVDAVFVAPGGDLYAFRGEQYVRYRPGEVEHVEEGYPRTVRDDWGDLPASFEGGIDGAFVFQGRTYLCKEDRYVRYSGDGYDAVDRMYPQRFRQRWSDDGDYRLNDVHAIARFAELARSRPAGDDGLAAFLAAGPAVEDPYRHLAGLFGWDAEEVRWVKRHGGFLPDTAGTEDRFEVESVLRLAELFEAAGRLGAGPSALFTGVWSRIHGADPAPADGIDEAVAVLAELLARRHGPQEWPVVSARLRDELNLARRDALVSAVLALGATGAPGGGPHTSRNLFEHLLIDVDMGARGRTSRVREAIAATQLYLHRYFLDLEPVAVPDGVAESDVRRRLKTWWGWMRNYRIWEANRKVFLYPENYVRPELRDTKTPAFADLENDLLQGEITAEAVQRAYKRYLDEYTEVSRLAIAGGYVYEGSADGTRDLVLFGRTRTRPRRFYYRRAQFRDGARLSTSWGPWLKVDVQIDAEKVYPIYAFDRVFVFWVAVEPVTPERTSSTTVVARQEGDTQEVSTPAAQHQVRIYYSFYNLNQEWVTAQVLGTGEPRVEPIPEVTLSVRSGPLPGQPSGVEHESIIVSFTLPPPEGSETPVETAFALTPEMYAVPVTGATAPAARPGQVSEILADVEAEAVEEFDVVRFNQPVTSADRHWLSIDHKGGSFLCRPVTPAPEEGVRPLPLKANKDRLPSWDRIDAAFELPDGTRYFFNNETRLFVAIKPDKSKSGPAKPIAGNWGEAGNNLLSTGVVDAVLRRDGHTYVFSGGQYLRYSGTPFGPVDAGYPKDLAGNTENLPQWSRVDAALTGPGGVEYFFSRERKGFVQSGALGTLRPVAEHWRLSARPVRERSGEPDEPAFGRDGIDATLVRGEHTYLFSGDQYVRYTGGEYGRLDAGYPRQLSRNEEGLPRWERMGSALFHGEAAYFFDNTAKTCLRVARDGTTETTPNADLGTRWWTVDAAYVDGGRLYLTRDREYVRYTLAADGSVPATVDRGYPRPLRRPVDAVFARDGRRFVFSGDRYGVLQPGRELDTVTTSTRIEGNWGDLPSGFPGPLTGLLDGSSDLYLFLGGEYVAYPKTAAVPRPYEVATLPHEIVRLTTSTAYKLNQRLLAGGVAALLAPETQETDELPAFSVEVSDPTTVLLQAGKVAADRLPAGSHLDFQSANSVYYWEIFFHGPLLIAQALNNAQRFEDARTWYEYVFDPTEPGAYWRFLPFLAIDVRALADSCAHDLEVLRAEGAGVSALSALLEPVLARLTELAPAFQERDLSAEDLDYLRQLAAPGRARALADAVRAVGGVTGGEAQAALDGLRERTAMLSGLTGQYNLLGDPGRLLAAYREDPFDPHAIAQLRPVAYRRAVVMAYIDNLLDWGDLLFRQYTAESVDEARMLYIFAHDLLGERPDHLGPRPLPPARRYAALEPAPTGEDPAELNGARELTAGGKLLAGPGAVHRSIAHPYFHVPENSAFAEYWDRVEDRLRKIRQSLDIMGVGRPVPLFDPPVDPMALVRGVASGAAPETLAAGRAVPVPHHRFGFVFRKAQDLADRLRGFGGDLLGVLERRDAEQLTLLQATQEQVILGLTRGIREAQVRLAAENLAEAEAGRSELAERVRYYEDLIANGLTPLQEAQVAMMSLASAAHLVASGLKIGSAVAHGAPQVLIGPFIMGTMHGGENIGESLGKASEVSESLGEGLSVLGELLGVRAEHESELADWRFQLTTAKSDLVQAGHQVAMAEQQAAMARRELEVHDQEIAHNESVTAFLKDKFSGAELYQWMSGQLSSMYFQTYGMAHDMAKAAERAYRFERGAPEGEEFIRSVYWDSRRNGLLAGESLVLDLERLGKAYTDSDTRKLEITKRVSLLALDPVALLRLKSTGTCEFALTEALYDYDFPGHYRRQIRTVSVAFHNEDGPHPGLHATLTQIGHKTVLAADPKAVRHLLDPKGMPPETLRADWRPSQQIALSQVGDAENNGLFELRFDDDRYLPFEGTGAVSTWRLDLTGQRSADRPEDLRDVVIIVRYTAEQGGEPFANAVKGMLKPYTTARFFDVARDFPREWAAFLGGEEPVLTLRFTPDMFPGMHSRQIAGVFPRYDLAGRSGTRFVLNGDPRTPLNDGAYLPTPGLGVAPGEGVGWTFVLEGDREALRGFGLAMTYKAGVR
ncbi:hypothetical protein Misp01_22330 [Microtetraspora sp. NBRC 13810]|uniref:hemopexin repeat-containing protein n=1 Tax=Microtetraspora sp. NBRC 13810 TaxID=3030990 RepID=UPI0024A4EF34|nr:hemopexin repeat-containing protein [Microtetraspora sp. NBRC 13810]GLW07103.1 hypothetical protein Misp01_22330 [Microtetraspora sp. NBRC 13810]